MSQPEPPPVVITGCFGNIQTGYVDNTAQSTCRPQSATPVNKQPSDVGQEKQTPRLHQPKKHTIATAMWLIQRALLYLAILSALASIAWAHGQKPLVEGKDWATRHMSGIGKS